MADEIRNSDLAVAVCENSAGAIPGPLRAHVRFDRVDWCSFGIASAFALLAYWLTLPPNVTLEWSGVLSVGAMHAGVAPPPGYPLWTLYSWVFVKLLPFSNIAWRVAVGSAVASALACGLVALIVSHGGQLLFKDLAAFARLGPRERHWLRGVSGYAAGLTLGFSGAVWDQAVIVGIWSLSLLLFTGIVCMLMFWMFEPQRRGFLFVGFFLFGLLLTSSQEMIVLAPGLICAMILVDRKLGRDAAFLVLPLTMVAVVVNQYSVWIVFPDRLNWPLVAANVTTGVFGALIALKTRRFGTEWRPALLCGLCLLLGLSLYLYVPVASMSNPPVNWGYPRTAEGFFHVIGRGQFEKLSPTSDPCQFVKQLWMYVEVAGKEFGWPHLIVSLLPFCLLLRMNRVGRRLLSGFFLVWIGVAPLLIAELNPPSDRELIKLYYAASYVLLAVWFGFGLLLLGIRMTKPDNTSA